MATTEQIENVFFDFIAWATSEPEAQIVWSEQGLPPPSGPYASLSWLTGFVKKYFVDGIKKPKAGSSSNKLQQIGQRYLTFNVQRFGEDWQDWLEKVQSGLRSQFANEHLELEQRCKFTIGAAVVGNTYSIIIDNESVSYVALTGDTQEYIRDALLSRINLSSLVPVKANTIDMLTNELETRSKKPGDEYLFDASVNITNTKTQIAVDLSFIEDIGITKLTDDIDGPNFQHRGSLDIRFGTHTQIYEDGEPIETVEITGILDDVPFDLDTTP